MSKSSGWSYSGPGLLGWVFLIFLTLKLTGYIGWSWWWVTAPLWGGLALTLVLAMVFVFVAVLVAALKG